MPTIMTHAMVGFTLAQLIAPGRRDLSITSAFCAMLPDADVLGLASGVAYGDLFGHRGVTHSVAFAASLGVAGGAWFQRARTGICLALVTLSHGLLDALTDGGRGVGFLIPFSTERFFFPWRPIDVSPIGLRFFSLRGLHVFMSEFLWVWIPSVIVLGLCLWRNRRRA